MMRASSTQPARTPLTATEKSMGGPPSLASRPKFGFSPTMPHREAGMRMEPPPSEPAFLDYAHLTALLTHDQNWGQP